MSVQTVPRSFLLNPLLLLLGVGLFLILSRVEQPWFNPDGWPLLAQFLSASLQPDLSAELLMITVDATLVTLAYAVCGTFLSVLLGLVGGLGSSAIWWELVLPGQKGIWLVLRGLLAIPRGIHEIIWGIFFVNLWGLDPLVAVVAIALPFGAITAKVFSEILDETPRQPLLTLIQSGVSPFVAVVYGLLPQAFLNLLSYGFYRFECSLRSAAVLGIIGAGGLGYQILLSLQSLRYNQLWTFFYALLLLNGTVDLLSALLRRRLGCTPRIALPQGKLRSVRPQGPVLLVVSLGLGLLVPFCFWYIHPDVSKLWAPHTGELLAQLGQSAFPPELTMTTLQQLLPLALQTLGMSVLAILVAGVGGVLLSFPAASNFRRFLGMDAPWGWLFLLGVRGVLLLFRTIPAPIWALVFLFVLFPGILPGALALGIHNLGILGRLMAEGIENLDQRPLQALPGASPLVVFSYGVLPATLPGALAYTLYRWEVCMRETVLVGLVGAGGLGRLLSEQLSSFDYRGMTATLSVLILLTFLVDVLSTQVRNQLRYGINTRKSGIIKGGS